MKIITRDEIVKALDEFNKKENLFDLLMKDLENEQIAIMEYILEIEEDSINSSERSLLISAVLIGWHIIRSAIGKRKEVDDEYLDLQLQWNLEQICGEDENDEDEDILDEYYAALNGQYELMLHVISFIYEAKEHGAVDREDNLYVLALHAKTVMDCLLVESREHLKNIEVEESSDADNL